MRSTCFRLQTEWRIDASRDRVWAALRDVEAWPDWWRSVYHVTSLGAGDANGVGATHRLEWRTALPYRLAFDMRTIRAEPMTLIEGRAEGELDGIGRWTLHEAGTATLVRYDWQVRLTKTWMRALAPLLRRVFAWNHNVVMERGRRGLARHLSCADGG